MLSVVNSGAYLQSSYGVHEQIASPLVPHSSSPHAPCSDFSLGSGGWVDRQLSGLEQPD